MNILRWFRRTVDWKRDDRGFVLRLFFGDDGVFHYGYVEVSLDRPTKEVNVRVIYGESS